MSLFSRRTVVALLAFGLGTFALGLVLAAFSGDLFGRASWRADTYSRSLAGHRGAAELLRRCGLPVIQGLTPRSSQARAGFPLLALEPPLEAIAAPGLASEDEGVPLPDADQEKRLARLLEQALAAQAPVVLGLPKRRATPSPVHPGWIGAEQPLPLAAVERVLELGLSALHAAQDGEAPVVVEAGEGPPPQRSAPRLLRMPDAVECRAEPLGLPTVALEPSGELQALAAVGGVKPLVECAGGVVVGELGRAGRPPLVVIADPDLFNNRGLARGDHALLLWRLLSGRLRAQGVIIDETLHGHVGGEALVARALSFPLGLVSAHAALAFILAGWWLSGRFGKPRPPPPALPPGKALLLENTARLLRSASPPRASLERYLQGVLQELGRRCGTARGTSEDGLLDGLSALGRVRGVGEDPRRLRVAVRAAGLTPPEALRLARRIHAWRAALLGLRPQDGVIPGRR